MNEINKMLKEESKRINKMGAPDELEARLKNAVRQKPKRISPMWKIAAIAVLLLFMVGYQYNAFAYYGKKILGFDDILSGTLKDLNDDGMGQVVDRSYHLGQGTTITINGVLTDENRMIVYYTLSNPNGVDDSYENHFNPTEITGFLTKARYEGGRALINDEKTEIKGQMEFEPPSAFSKTLTLHYYGELVNGLATSGKLAFPYEPNEALETKFKQSINKKIKVDKGSVSFKSILATPTLTVINGTMSVANVDRISQPLSEIELLANGNPVQVRGSGMSSSFGDRFTFNLDYDALPKDLTSLQLHIKEFAGYKRVNQSIPLMKVVDDVPIQVGGQSLWIKNVSKASNSIEIKIKTEESVMLDEVFIGDEAQKVPLLTIKNQDMIKERNGTLMKERTLRFETDKIPEYMYIEGIHYMKGYDKRIDIPID
ncbi:DUF4179 domain-containing protein [Rossellomorea aquimaris]|uniref:DUF4179 domain-containing protein n=1 Tax=Rossellomorea aquimaris TaxID=189382 RepID=UPI0007D094EC|nr:DUF4179 domain-containing protein [Rossellomorea aquimaris]